jgi:hypothetical protein
VLAAVLGAGRAAAEPRLVAAFDDPAGDADGPGGYQPAGDSEFMDGDFDLRRFAVYVDGDEVLFEVTLGAPFRQPAVTQRTNSTELQLWNGIYLQNVDIYLDTSRAPGSGFGACIPGRRVAFADGRTWEAAVVLTPQPGPARAITRDALGDAAAHVIFPENLRARGRTVVARVPAAALGGLPARDWGYSVHVSGARWERSFKVTDRLLGRAEADAFTMPVLGVREAWAFGGAPAGNAHPRVVDVLLPPGVDQKAVLGSFDAATGALARVPFVQVEPERGPPAVAPAHPAPGPGAEPAAELSVADVADTLVSLSGSARGLESLRLGRVLGPDGATVARVVVIQVVEGGVVARAVEGSDRIARGARVRFDPPGR